MTFPRAVLDQLLEALGRAPLRTAGELALELSWTEQKARAGLHVLELEGAARRAGHGAWAAGGGAEA